MTGFTPPRRLGDAPAFIAAQLIGAVLAALLFRWLEAGEQ